MKQREEGRGRKRDEVTSPVSWTRFSSHYYVTIHQATVPSASPVDFFDALTRKLQRGHLFVSCGPWGRDLRRVTVVGSDGWRADLSGDFLSQATWVEL